ncbi:hypothetical protein GUY44_09240 [Pimelobacter simplex]|uniref:Uncharacterized protein n=1 Tax=Nocardioides simplex TaxID=2045 RepID=A0A0A1DGG4_NOCSI|nr:hypothetical protein [Pimelobacter simplex]AIY15593.1 hypothetical protein KR76_00185 [Pimelobacter simplex]MCG8150662.1 hypothetical protein [Pimelobacter simplex]GEB15184.1 hypothetical protein NSI01_34990 [Pimelobacter simplex]SFM85352.1 hypothetical protein SAMN05421671_3754 [Pimelobacter simplex]
MRGIRVGAALAGVVLLAACSSDPKPVYQRSPEPRAEVSEYDGSQEPSAAVLALVPTAATTLAVTDFDQLRLVLGFGTLKGSSPAPERERFWRQVPRTASLSTGLLRPVEAQLRERFGFGQDDVAWEATYSGGGAEGWVLAFHGDLAMASVRRAVGAGVGPLRGAVVDADHRLVTSATPPDAAQSWGAEPDLVALTGGEAVATYLQRGCDPFDTVFGAGMQAQLAAAPAAALDSLDPLDAYSVALGTELVTARLGENRSDAFERARLADVMPPTKPDFGLVMSRAVADPASGRIGYVLADPAAAARLTRTHHLPFTVCPG